MFKKTTYFYLSFLVLAILFLFCVAPKSSSAAGQDITGQLSPDYTEQSGETSSIILDVHQADLRDVLSALAIKMDRTIILLDAPVRVTFFVENVTPQTAMTLLLQNEGFDYLENDDCILVGRPERLKENYFNLMALSRFNLQNISAPALTTLIGELEIPLQILSLDTNPRTIWVQGTPRELGKVRGIITALDRPENADPETTSPLERLDLLYLNAEIIKPLIEQLALSAQVITMPVNPQAIWVQGTPAAVERLKELIAILDQPENAGFETKLDMARFRLNYMDAGKMKLLLKEAGIAEEYIISDETAHLLWVFGPSCNLEIARELIAAVDLPENSEQLPHIFIYQFNNISAIDAAERLNEMAVFNGVKTLTFNYPEISSELLVICPFHRTEQVYSTLGLLDEARRRIRMPVDSAGKRSALAAKRELLAELTGISISRMHISANLSGDSENPYYVLWVEETPDKVQQVRDMVEIIDQPRSGR